MFFFTYIHYLLNCTFYYFRPILKILSIDCKSVMNCDFMRKNKISTFVLSLKSLQLISIATVVPDA